MRLARPLLHPFDRHHVRRIVWPVVVLLILLVTLGVARVTSRSPSNDRVWTVDQSRMPRVTFRGDSVFIADFRRFRYTGKDAFTPRWDSIAVDLNRIERVWFALAPFGSEWAGTAHSFVTFAFSDSQFVAISVEGRREQGESYGFRKGMARQLEMIYVIGDENDLVRRRALYDGNPIYLYPVVSPVRRTREMFVAMLQRADQLGHQPEFYNLLTNNCTSNLVSHVNTLIPGRVPGGWQTLLPGYSDRVALEVGLIDAKGDHGSVRERFRINDVAAGLPDDATFSLRLHEALGDTLGRPPAAAR